jgi:tetratricopeptide (TPR) repeat protein
MQRTAVHDVVLALLLSAFAPAVSLGQPWDLERPQPLASRSPTAEERAHAEAIELYALGVLRQENDQLIEATRLFEKARELDPKSAPIHKILIPLYLALSRKNDAIAACRRVLELTPDDFATGAAYARQLKSQGDLFQARDALALALKSPELAQHPDARVQMLFDLGVLCEQLHQPNEAVNAFAEVVVVLDNPHSLADTPGFDRSMLSDQAAGIYERIIKLCLKARQYDRAITFFSEARRKHPEEAARLNYMIARMHFDRGDYQAALTALDAHLRTQPRGIEGYELRGAILTKLKREAEILPALERFAAQDAENTALQLFLARQYARFARVHDSERVYQKLLERAPTPEIYQQLFQLYEAQPALWGAKRVLEMLDQAVAKASHRENHADELRDAARARDVVAAIRSDAELGRALLSAARGRLQTGGKLDHQTLLFLALMATREHRFDEAGIFYRQCLDGTELGAREFAIYQGFIDILWRTQKYQELEALCRNGLQKSAAANHILLHLHLSQVLLLRGKMEEAIAEADKAVESASEDRRLAARLNRIDVFGRAGRVEKSVAEAQQLLKAHPQPGEVRDIRLRLANIYLSIKDYRKSEEQLQLVLKADANDATANNDLGYQWADQGKNLEEAERMIRKAIDLDLQQKKTAPLAGADENSDNAAFLDSLGWVLFRRGQLKEAREWLEKASALPGGSDDPVVWDHLGDVYLAMRESRRAKESWRKGLLLFETGARSKTDEHYPELRSKLETVP